jgi:hypothetical protein
MNQAYHRLPAGGANYGRQKTRSAILLFSIGEKLEGAPGIKHNFRPGFWIRGGSRAFARISSHTLGRYVVVTNPAPPRCRSNGLQRISMALQTTPEEPRQRNGPLGAPKLRPDPPQPAPHPPRLVCGRNHGAGTHWCPSGGDPRWRRPGRRRPKPRRHIYLWQTPRPLIRAARKRTRTGRHRQGPRPAELRKLKNKR